MFGRSRSTSRGGGGLGRVVIGLVIAAIAVISFLSSREFNPITGEEQYVSLSPSQEIALGLQAAPEMEMQFGGEARSSEAQSLVDQVGQRLLTQSDAKDTVWQFEFTVLADDQTVNAFALPGGPVYITAGLLRLLESEGQLAGVLAHEIGHVVARHASQRIAKEELAQGLSNAAVVGSGDYSAGQIAAVVGQMVNMKYGRDEELESDRLGVRFMSQAGYDPRSMTRVMEILASASGGSSQPEFASTHPTSENRIAEIEQAIRQQFPDGVPEGLQQ